MQTLHHMLELYGVFEEATRIVFDDYCGPQTGTRPAGPEGGTSRPQRRDPPQGAGNSLLKPIKSPVKTAPKTY